MDNRNVINGKDKQKQDELCKVVCGPHKIYLQRHFHKDQTKFLLDGRGMLKEQSALSGSTAAI